MAKMNIVELATRNRAMLERLLAKCGGALGEILVEDSLAALGYSVEPTNNNARQRDMVVISSKGTSFHVEVKTSREKRACWPVRVCPDPRASDIWCLVCAPREPTALPDMDDVEIFVLTSTEARDIWLASDWNKKNPTNGDIRRWQLADDTLSAWHKLPDYAVATAKGPV